MLSSTCAPQALLLFQAPCHSSSLTRAIQRLQAPLLRGRKVLSAPTQLARHAVQDLQVDRPHPPLVVLQGKGAGGEVPHRVMQQPTGGLDHLPNPMNGPGYQVLVTAPSWQLCSTAGMSLPVAGSGTAPQ